MPPKYLNMHDATSGVHCGVSGGSFQRPGLKPSDVRVSGKGLQTNARPRVAHLMVGYSPNSSYWIGVHPTGTYKPGRRGTGNAIWAVTVN